MTRGILGAGAYAPRNRIDAAAFEDAWGSFEADGVDSKAVPDADEDALTMAVEASRRALSAAAARAPGASGASGSPAATGSTPDADADEAGTVATVADLRDATGVRVEQLWFATTTPPLAEEDLTPRLASYLDLPDDVTATVTGGHTAAGIDALCRALDADGEGRVADGAGPDADETGSETDGAEPDADGAALVVASDCPASTPDDPREHAAGAGAAAFVVGPDAPARVVDRATVTDPRPGTRFRRRGSADLEGLDAGTYDRAAYVEPVESAVDALAADGPAATAAADVVEDPDAVALQAPDGRLPYRTALDAEAIAAVETVSGLGDTGAASVPLSIARAFDTGADRTLAVAWASGARAVAMAIEGTAPVETDLDVDSQEATDLTYPAYLRRRGDVVGETPDGGAAHVPVPTWRRSIPQRHRHVAGRCPECGVVAFPPEGACPDCLALVSYEAVEPALEGTVEAVTTIGRGGAPPEFAEQQARQGAFGVAVVRFPAGEGSVSLPMQVHGEVDVGDAVRAVPRLIYEEEGVPRYGLKALPR